MSRCVYQLEPLFLSKIWGGTQLQSWYSLKGEDLKIGEVWSASAMPEGDVQVRDQGKTLSVFLKENPDLFPMKSESLPFHITLIDALDDLSIQVHPSDLVAKEKGLVSGLSEAWMVLKAEAGAKIELGHNATSKTQLESWIQNHQWNKILNYHEVKAHDLFFIPAGTMHAIGKGCLIYEISQNVDVTYRLYDYDRVDAKSGKMRELHLEDALKVIQAPDPFTYKDLYIPVGANSDSQILLQKKGLFQLSFITSNNSAMKRDDWGFLTVIEGEGTLDNVNVKTGDTVLIGRCDELRMTGSFKGIFASIYD
jgi:mannose-6-phosphate isomerase class I